MQRIKGGNTTVQGLDVSHWDENIDWGLVKAAGRQFAFAKCTEYSADKNYARNKAGAQAAGILFGAYHFLHPKNDPKKAAELFLKMADIKAGDLQPVLDWETTDFVPSYVDRDRATVWLDIVEKATGRPPIIYGSPYFLEALGLSDAFERYALWIAHYKVSMPLVPRPWRTWAFWQHSETGDMPGIPAPDEDLDIFNGSIEQLKKFTL